MKFKVTFSPKKNHFHGNNIFVATSKLIYLVGLAKFVKDSMTAFHSPGLVVVPVGSRYIVRHVLGQLNGFLPGGPALSEGANRHLPVPTGG